MMLKSFLINSVPVILSTQDAKNNIINKPFENITCTFLYETGGIIV